MKIQLIATWKAYNCDTTKDDMEVETEPNVYVIIRLIYYGVQTLC